MIVECLHNTWKLKLDERVANIWPGFGINRKDLIKVHHVLNHTAGLHNAMPNALENPSFISDWEGCLNSIVTSTPESEPGQEQLYHYASFGWLCGGIIEHASGKKFQEILDEAIIHPLNIEGELYIGIPPGVESRLASLTSGMEDYKLLPSVIVNQVSLPSTFQPTDMAGKIALFAEIYNNLKVRQAIVPSANGHCSARALARYYAALAAGGFVPPPYSPSKDDTSYNNDGGKRMFRNPKILDAFMGVGDYGGLARQSGSLGLGFKRSISNEGLTGFGHAGMGGSNGFCDIKHQFAVAVVVNKMSTGTVTGFVAQLICSELNVPLPQEFAAFGKGTYMKLN